MSFLFGSLCGLVNSILLKILNGYSQITDVNATFVELALTFIFITFVAA